MGRVLAEVRERMRALFLRSQEDAELDEELRFHMEMEVEAGLRRGLSEREARRAASLKLGGVERYKEEVRDARGIRVWDELRQDLRYGLRVLARRPGFTLVALLTLAVGIGAATAVFSLANAVLLRPTPGVTGEDRLVEIRFRAPHLEDEETGISYSNLRDLLGADLTRRRSTPGGSAPGGPGGAPPLRSVERMTAWAGGSYQVAVPGQATAILSGAAIAGDYFGTLGVRRGSGRLIRPEETALGQSEAVAVLSERARTELFGPASDPVGRRIHVNGLPFVVVGVTAGGFRGTDRVDPADIWIPYGQYPAVRHMDPEFVLGRRASSHFHDLVVRLAPGATPAGVEAELGAALDRLMEAYPGANEHFADYRPKAYEDIRFDPWTRDRLRVMLGLLLGGVALVLLVACANVSNLLVFRGVRRQGETAVRRATGASRGRLLRQHLTESALLTAGAVVLGVLAALAAGGVLARLMPVGRSPLEEVPLDARVLAFATAAGAAAVLLAGLVPAWVASRVDLVGSLKDAGPTETGRKRRLRRGLTVIQVALSLALLVGGLLLTRTLLNLNNVPLGFEPAGVVEAYVDPEPQGYDDAAANRFQRDLLAAAARIPGASAAALAAAGPLMASFGVDLRPGGGPGDRWPVQAYADYVSPGYFNVLRIPLRQGRTFSDEEMTAGWDGTSSGAVINESLARRLFPDRDPLGQTFVERGYRENTRLTVIGVVADSRTRRNLDGPVNAAMYRPLGEHYSNRAVLLVRSPRPPETVIPSIRTAVDQLDPSLPLGWARPLSELILQATAGPRLLARLMLVLASLAGLLAAVGLYGVVAFSVAERTREVGVRVAMGAGSRDVVALVVRQALGLTAVGIVIGFGLAWGLGQVLSSQLFGVEPVDPVTWAAAAGVFTLLAVAAAAVPARAAARVDPVRALRSS